MKINIVLLIVALSGCNYDSGSSHISKTFGKSYQKSCIIDNISRLEGYQTEIISGDKVEISKTGVSSSLSFASENESVTGYTLETKTEKNQDKILHKEIELAIIKGCGT